jgi:hypothetical protein
MNDRPLSDKDLKRLTDHMTATGTASGFVPTPKKKRKNEEWRLQSFFFRWWRASAKGLGVWPGCCYHIPNGSMLGDDANSRVIRARMLALAGVETGVVDVFLMVPRGKWHGMYVEFKKPGVRNHKNGGCTDEQVEFLAYATANGYHCVVCYSWEEGRDAVVKYLKT